MARTVVLTPNEYTFAAHAGFLREVESVLHNRKDSERHENGSFNVHILGAIAEYVVAKELGLFWSGLETFSHADVGPFHVRSSKYPNGSLIVRKNDPNEVFILVTGDKLEYTIQGWMYGGNAKRKMFEKNPNGGAPAFFVPQEYLRDIEELETLSLQEKTV